MTPWVVTGFLAAAAGATGALALRSSSELKKRRDQFGSQHSDLSARASRTKTLALAADILLGGTLLAAGVSTYLTVSRSDGVTELALVRRF